MSNPVNQAKSDDLKRALDLWSAHQDLLRARPVDGTSDSVELFVAKQELLAAAEEFHAAVAPYRRQFIAAGAPPDFLETLQANIDRLRQAVAKFDSRTS